ncbi:hypothetical protein SEMRO_1706_G292550.1 [Seminavis robusta]|uniref:Uncharacterized protein n=1 Tax=Seminavis robusta TaxID=568900 RepID=A0A9N8ETA9_9STRA|nr:hypothetical protein SEMRO_1706_G292550.1 [Seminavis robusta]|eukprot:Sro1706_g292550.1 n/a (412) ;mRNA; f:20144-21379
MSSEKHFKRRKKEQEDCESSENESERGNTRDGDQTIAISLAKQMYQDSWVGLIRRHGTVKLPKKPWMKTRCMKLNSERARVSVFGGSYNLPTVMMCGSNMPPKQRKLDAVDSICRTRDCIIPNHHRWLPKREKLSRECCGNKLMCCTCHIEIPLPCSHDPPCQWSVASNQSCSSCDGAYGTRNETFGSAISSSTNAKIHQATGDAVVTIAPARDTKRKYVEQQGEESPSRKTMKNTDNAYQQSRSFKNTKTKDKSVADILSHLDNQHHVEKGFHEAWVRVVRQHGTIELPRKSWMKTHCMKLNHNIKKTDVLRHGNSFPLSSVMMHGTNMPPKQNEQDAIVSICQTPNCVIAGHHSWMSKVEKWTRASCGASLMCPTCHIEISFPCSHNPPCKWRLVSKEECVGCNNKEEK